jgi:hypothetical protein
MTPAEFLAEYTRLGHAIQTGVAMEMHEPSVHATEPKHLRTGLDCVMADLGSLTRLLVQKGVITEDEYFEAILDGLRREIEAYEARIKARMGGHTSIHLG